MSRFECFQPLTPHVRRNSKAFQGQCLGRHEVKAEVGVPYLDHEIIIIPFLETGFHSPVVVLETSWLHKLRLPRGIQHKPRSDIVDASVDALTASI